MQDKKPALVEALLDFIPVFMAFLVPVFFLPITSEFFEFNKLALITITSALMLLVWVAKMLKNKKVEVTKSPLDFALLAFFIVVLLSTIFSLNKTASLFGSQGRWFPSLFGLVTLVVMYYTVSSNVSGIKAIRNVIYATLAGITLSSLVAILGYYGIKFGQATFLQINNFTLTGSSVTAAVLAGLAMPLSLVRVLGKNNSLNKWLLTLAAAINFVAVVLLGSVAGWATMVAGLLMFAYFAKHEELMASKIQVSSLFVFIVLAVSLMIVPATRNMLINEDYPQELKISPRESWVVVSSVIRDFPVLGTGPSTFNINYTRYKPLSANANDYWNVRFDKPYSEAFSAIGGLGIVGVIVSLAFVLKSLKFTLDTKRNVTNHNIAGTLAVGVVGLLTAFAFTYSTVATAFLFFMFLALVVAKNRIESVNRVESVHLRLSSLTTNSGMSLVSGEKEVLQYIVALPLTALAIVGGFYLYKQYAAEYYMRRAIAAAQENNGSLTYQMQQKAISVNPRRDAYHNSYANTNLALATTLATQDEVTEDEKTTIQALIAQAIRSSRVTTEVLNPLSAANWETRANIYRALIGVAEDAEEWAVRSLNAAIQLDPANPRLRLALGGIYYANQDYLSAANLFNQAVSLKNDYANAHYNLAQAYKQLNRLPEAQRELLIVERLVTESSEDAEKVAAELRELSSLGDVAGASDKPTVQDLETAAVGQQPQEQAPQEPLNNVGEPETLEGTDLDITDQGQVQQETSTNSEGNQQAPQAPAEQPQQQPSEGN